MAAAAPKAKPTSTMDLPKAIMCKRVPGLDAYSLREGDDAFDAVIQGSGLMTEGLAVKLDPFDHGDAVGMRFFQPLSEGSTRLVPKTTSATQAEEWDSGEIFAANNTILFLNSTLRGNDPLGGLRADGIDHVLFGAVRTFWPPPCASPFRYAHASKAWEVMGTLEDDMWRVSEADVAAFRQWAQATKLALFRVISRAGRPTKRWVIRIMDDTEQVPIGDYTAGDTVFKAVNYCALCSRSPPWAEYHDHTQCPYIGTLNKVREGLGYMPVDTSDGVINLNRDKKPIDSEALFKGLKSSLDALERRVKSLEDRAPTSSKRKAPANAEAGPSSKKARKEDGKGEEKKKPAEGAGGKGKKAGKAAAAPKK